MNLFNVKDKWSAVLQEQYFNQEYFKVSNPVILFPPKTFDKGNKENNYEMKFGRNNQILENEYLKKYKGTWNPNMIKESEEYVKRGFKQ
jgi:hypothetical protein